MGNFAVISPESFARIPGIIVQVIHISYKLSTDFGVLSTVLSVRVQTFLDKGRFPLEVNNHIYWSRFLGRLQQHPKSRPGRLPFAKHQLP